MNINFERESVDFANDYVKFAIKTHNIELFAKAFHYCDHSRIEWFHSLISKLPLDERDPFIRVIVCQTRIDRVDVYEYILKLAKNFGIHDGVSVLSDVIAPILGVANAVEFADNVWA